jgi:hypothetical protein
MGTRNALPRLDGSTVPADGRPPLSGLMPALVGWSTAHPALGLDDRGCHLVALEARHPDPERLRRALDAVGVDGLGGVRVRTTEPGQSAHLAATIEKPRGPRRLGGLR